MRYALIILLLTLFIDIGESKHSYYSPVKYDEFILDRLTVYNPSQGQTDSTPLITASNAKIDTVNLRKGKVRWIALSRDFLARWGGKIQYGDTIEIISDDSDIAGEWVVQDTMNKRYKKSGDILTYNRKRGLWKQVKFRKYDTKGESI